MSKPQDTGTTQRHPGTEVIDELENLEITTELGEDEAIDYPEADEDSGDRLVDDIESWVERNG